MPKLIFDGTAYNRADAETVLDCLLRHDVAVPHSCRTGICQSCMMRAVNDDPPAEAQKGLKQTLKEQKYFLACSCTPAGDFEATSEAPEMFHVPARVLSVDKLGGKIARVRLDYPRPFEYRPGQFLNLHRDDGLIRSYSIASIPQLESFIELHVQRNAGGRMSPWIHDEMKAGDAVRIGTPLGECFYRPGKSEQPLLLVGTGSGLAPLYGVVRDALRCGHAAPIWLFHGSRTQDGLYLMDELRHLARDYANFNYVPCLSGEPDRDGFISMRANDAALQQHINLKHWRVFLCGHPDMVNATKKKSFLAGASLNEIHADAFVLSRG